MTVDELDNGKGHEGPKSDPPEPLPGPSVNLERSYPICGVPKRQGGDPCTQKAGWGTDHVGMGKCKDPAIIDTPHDGSSWRCRP